MRSLGRRARLRSVHAFIGVVLIASLLGVNSHPATAGRTGFPPVRAVAAVLMDAKTGQILWARAPHLRWRPASTTKMLTAMLVVDSLPDDLEVTISPRAAAERSGRAIGLIPGERWRVGDLFRALLVHSANDAAIALAEAVAGSVEAFATRMNATAQALGTRDSHFVVPHGLEAPRHYSSAYDLALIARAALQKPRIAEVVRLRTWELIRPGQFPRLLVNSNRLLWQYPNADGVKTGWIPQSGHCLIGSATRGGRRLIVVILDDNRPFTDAAALLDYGFANFPLAKLAEAGEVMATIPVANGATPLVAVVPDEVVGAVREGASVTRQVMLTEEAAPIPRAAVVGRVVYASEGEEVASALLVAHESVPPTSLWTHILSWVSKAFEQWL